MGACRKGSKSKENTRAEVKGEELRGAKGSTGLLAVPRRGCDCCQGCSAEAGCRKEGKVVAASSNLQTSFRVVLLHKRHAVRSAT